MKLASLVTALLVAIGLSACGEQQKPAPKPAAAPAKPDAAAPAPPPPPPPVADTKKDEMKK